MPSRGSSSGLFCHQPLCRRQQVSTLQTPGSAQDVRGFRGSVTPSSEVRATETPAVHKEPRPSGLRIFSVCSFVCDASLSFFKIGQVAVEAEMLFFPAFGSIRGSDEQQWGQWTSRSLLHTTVEQAPRRARQRSACSASTGAPRTGVSVLAGAEFLKG